MRTLRLVLITALIIVVLYLLLRGRLLFGRPTTPALALPVDLQEIIPASWQVFTGPDKFVHCDFDGDGEQEWLVLYRYDQTSVVAPYSRTASPIARSAIGGVIYNPQVNRVPQRPGVQSPFRPAFLFPYKLLPDIYPDKGQGYLGEADVTLRYSPQLTLGAACRVDEIAAFGYGDEDPLPTRLSLFRWDAPGSRYLSRHFVGNARLQASPALPATDPINQVTTYNRFNDRSRLCEVQSYRRPAPDRLDFNEDRGQYTIGFCFEAPPDPAYPEGVVVATLRGHNPGGPPPIAGAPTAIPALDMAQTPTGGSFLTANAAARLPAALANLRDPVRDPYRILVLQNPGSLPGYPLEGEVITDTTTGQLWLWSTEPPVVITTTVVLPGGARDISWRLRSMANWRVRADTHWRIDNVQLVEPAP